MAVPVVCTVAVSTWRRQLDVIGAIAVVTFGVALLVMVLSGGNPFVLKLQEAVVTGPVGVVFLVSAAVRQPMLLMVARLAKRRASHAKNAEHMRVVRQQSTVLTAVMGGVLVVHAVALTVLASLLSTAQVLAVSRLVGLTILGVGFAVLLTYRARLRRGAVRAA